MTQAEQVSLAIEKCTRWTAKQQHANAMLATWQKQLAKLQGAKPVEPTAAKLPPLVIDPKVVSIEQAKAKKKTPPKPKK